MATQTPGNAQWFRKLNDDSTSTEGTIELLYTEKAVTEAQTSRFI